MNILVFLKMISQQQFADRLEDRDERLTSGSITISPTDLYALELALRIKDRTPDTAVTAVTMAPRDCERELRQAIAIGADAAVLIADRRLAGSDTLVTARTLAAALKKLPRQDLLLCGKKSTDSETGHIGPQLAALLGLPLASNVTEFSAEDGLTAVCVREDSLRTFRSELPAVITACYGTGAVRCPTVSGIRRSRSAEVLLFDLDDIGVAAEEAGTSGSPTKVVRTERFWLGTRQGVITHDAGEGAKLLAEAIKKCGGVKT